MAPSSLHTNPSAMTMTSATSQPASACGPPRADISSGMVMNGPTPIMLDMFSAVDCSSPNRRSSVGPSAEDEDIRPPILLGDGRLPLRDSRDVPMMLTMVCRALPMSLLLVVLLSLPGRAPAQDTAPTLPPGDDWQRCSAEAAGLDPALLRTAVAYASEHETKRPRDYSDQVRIFGRPLGPLPPARGGTNGLILRRGCLVAEFGDT